MSILSLGRAAALRRVLKFAHVAVVRVAVAAGVAVGIFGTALGVYLLQ